MKKEKRTTTSLTIDKDDLPMFNELRARESGRKGTNLSQNKFVKELLTFFKNAKQGKMDEGDLCDLILCHVHVLSCFNCGARLEEKVNLRQGDTVGILHIDPGRSNYPREPDEPAELYLECVECSNDEQCPYPNIDCKTCRAENKPLPEYCKRIYNREGDVQP